MKSQFQTQFKKFMTAHFPGAKKVNFDFHDAAPNVQMTYAGGVHSITGSKRADITLQEMTAELAAAGIGKEHTRANGEFTLTIPNTEDSLAKLTRAAEIAAQKTSGNVVEIQEARRTMQNRANQR